MKLERSTVLYFAVFMAAITMICSSVLSIGSTSSELNLDEEVDRLIEIVIQNPMATKEIDELGRLQRQKKQQVQNALNSLINGMSAFKEGRFKVASQELDKANRCTFVKDVAKSFLPNPNLLNKIIAECSQYQSKTLCRECNGSGIECCPTCSGIGVLPCLQCTGTGKQVNPNIFNRQRGRRSLSNFQQSESCKNCGGLGCIPCPLCDGQAILLCKRCHKEVGGLLNVEDYDAIETLLDVIGYLNNGGIDFISENALKPLLMTIQVQK